jgi:mRNA interferase HigB
LGEITPEATLRVVSLRLLREYWNQPGRQTTEQPLKTWFAVVRGSRWASLIDIKKDVPTVDIAHRRYVFDIKGNNCRLICSIDFVRHGVLILWVGTHDDYDELMKNDGRKFRKIYGEMS